MPYRSRPLREILDLRDHEEPHVTPQQLAIYWQVHEVSVQRWLREKRLIGTRFRGVWRVKPADALDFEATVSIFAAHKSA